MSAVRRLLRNENHYNFIRAWRIGLAASAVLVVVSLLSLFARGLNWGIDFEGGTSWELPANGLSVGQARDVLRPFGQATATIQTLGGNTLRVKSPVTAPEDANRIRDALASAAKVEPTEVAVTTVGPTWGSEISRKAVRALIFFLVAVALYITWTLREWRMAVGALVAVLHDIAISLGVYSVFQIEVTPATVIAFLTILGFSLYDTVVVFDKVRENTPRVSVAGRMTYTEMANLSMNQVLMRSINTSLTALMPVACILVVGAWIMGATTLEEFGLALLVGLIAGTYSSIFVATPVVARLKEREAQYRLVRERLGRRAGEVVPAGERDPAGARGGAREGRPAAAGERRPVVGGAAPATATASAVTAEGAARAGTGASTTPASKPPGRNLPPGYSSSHPPRPRKKGRR
jgi:preprotein translocase subunit SecF